MRDGLSRLGPHRMDHQLGTAVAISKQEHHLPYDPMRGGCVAEYRLGHSVRSRRSSAAASSDHAIPNGVVAVVWNCKQSRLSHRFSGCWSGRAGALWRRRKTREKASAERITKAAAVDKSKRDGPRAQPKCFRGGQTQVKHAVGHWMENGNMPVSGVEEKGRGGMLVF